MHAAAAPHATVFLAKTAARTTAMLSLSPAAATVPPKLARGEEVTLALSSFTSDALDPILMTGSATLIMLSPTFEPLVVVKEMAAASTR